MLISSFIFLKISDPIEDAFGDVTTPQKSEGIRAVSTSPDMILKTPKGNRGLQYGKTECRCGAANCRKYFFWCGFVIVISQTEVMYLDHSVFWNGT